MSASCLRRRRQTNLLADQETINVTRAATATPAVYTVPGSTEIQPLSAFASFNGAAAASAYLPTLTFYSDAGIILARVFPGVSVAAGVSADVTFAPFLGDANLAGGAVQSVHGASVRTTVVQSTVGGNVPQNLSFGATNFDTDGYWSAGAPTRLTIPTGLGGLYQVNCRGVLSWGGTDSPLEVHLNVNGSPPASLGIYAVGYSQATVGTSLPFSVLWQLSAGDFLELTIQHTIAAAMNAPAKDNWMQCALVGTLA